MAFSCLFDLFDVPSLLTTRVFLNLLRAVGPRSRVITSWFQGFDLNGNGRIDQEEFAMITKHLTATMAWDDHQSAPL